MKVHGICAFFLELLRGVLYDFSMMLPVVKWSDEDLGPLPGLRRNKSIFSRIKGNTQK